MNKCDFEELYEIVLDVIEPRLPAVGFNRSTVKPNLDLLDVLDSFGVLDTIIEIEERAGVTADLAQMNFPKAITIGELTREIVRINAGN